MAEAGENSHGKNYLCKIGPLAANTDERQKTCVAALPKVFKIMQLTAQIQGGIRKLLAINLLAQESVRHLGASEK